MKYVKFMPGRDLVHQSRNRRELEAAREYGYDITVVSSDDAGYFNTHFPQYEFCNDGTIPVSYKMSSLKRHFLIIFSWFRVFKVARNVEADAVSCHDLDSLWMFWLSKRFKSHKPKLIYDSHEFELGRNIRRSKFKWWIIRQQERFMMKRCAFSIMVNDIIADSVQQIHKLKERPVVVRNIPYYWTIDPEECKKYRSQLLSEMVSPREVLLMFHGGLMENRGIELLLKVVSMNEHVCLILLGNSDYCFKDVPSRIIDELGIDDRVLLRPAVPIPELWKYVGAADIGMVTIPAIAKSYYYMLPNKFFENIQCMTPVICSDYPAIVPLVKKYGVGLTCDPTDAKAINVCIERLRNDKALYTQCKENERLAKNELCWEQEKNHLHDAFKKFL